MSWVSRNRLLTVQVRPAGRRALRANHRTYMKRLLVAATVLGDLFTIVDSGFAQPWTQTSAPVTNWSAVASSADGARLLAAVSDGLIYTSTDSGGTWTATSAPSANWSAVASSA